MLKYPRKDIRMRTQIIIHIDMDAFFAAVEIRDNKELLEKPVIIGSMPNERGVVCTCNYEARKYGIHSAMNIKEAYKRCPKAIFIRPDFKKYKEASNSIHRIWKVYSDSIEYMSLDEGYLDMTDKVNSFEEAIEIAKIIKKRTYEEIGLTCSAGVGYSLMSAKISSEENKPNGLFYIKDKKELVNLIKDRPVFAIYGVGKKTANRLHEFGIDKVSDIYKNEKLIVSLLKNHGKYIVDMAKGLDFRVVTPYDERSVKSIGREWTFNEDIIDVDTLKDSLLLLADEVAKRLEKKEKRAKTISLKVTYANMQTITRSKSEEKGTADVIKIYKVASKLLDNIRHEAIRLIGVSTANFSEEEFMQLNFEDVFKVENSEDREIRQRLEQLRNKFVL